MPDRCETRREDEGRARDRAELTALAWSSIYCVSCGKTVDRLLPLDAGGQVLANAAGQSLYGETLGDGEEFTLCKPAGGPGAMGEIYRVRRVSDRKVEHVAGPLAETR